MSLYLVMTNFFVWKARRLAGRILTLHFFWWETHHEYSKLIQNTNVKAGSWAGLHKQSLCDHQGHSQKIFQGE